MSRWRTFRWRGLDDGLPWQMVLFVALAFLVASHALRASGTPRPLRSPARATPLPAPPVRPSPNAEREPVCLRREVRESRTV